MRVLVTGGAGFIGSHIVDALVSRGDSVRVYDNFTSGKRENLAAVESKIEIVEGDIRDLPQLDYYAAGCDVIFHEAAIVSVPYSIEHPQETHDVNIQGTLNLLNAAEAQKMSEMQSQGTLQTCLASEMTIANMQQRNAAAQDLNSAALVQQQRATNDVSAANEGSTWQNYIP